jgi:hypothetical protein
VTIGNDSFQWNAPIQFPRNRLRSSGLKPDKTGHKDDRSRTAPNPTQ